MRDQKSILLSGASGVIGTATARRLATAGYDLHLTSRHPSKLTALSDELRSKGVKVTCYTLDLLDRQRCREVVDEFCDHAEVPFGLVCNAGNLGEVGAFLATDLHAWITSIEHNFLSHVAMIHAFGRRCVSAGAREGAVVVLSGAGVGSAPTPHLSSYGTSKAALTYLVEALSSELMSAHLTINAIAPGQVNSGMTDQAIAAGEQRVGEFARSAQACKVSGGVSPDLAAQLVEFLMSPAARQISGRLLSARFDQKRLRNDVEGIATDPNLYRLRRIDNDLFSPSATGEKR